MTRPPEERSLEELFAAWRRGDPTAFDAIVPEVYEILHSRVQRVLRREQQRDVLDTTDLLHDLYLKLRKIPPSRSPAHFIGTAVEATKNYLVDLARMRRSRRRGGAFSFVTLDGLDLPLSGPDQNQLIDILAVANVIEVVRTRDPKMATHIELRIFFGMTEQEIASALGVSRSAIQREWSLAKRVLLRELVRSGQGETDDS